MMSFNQFVYKLNLKIKASSNKEIYQTVCSIGLNNICLDLRDGPFSSVIGVVNLHPSKGTHWVRGYMKITLIVMGLSVQRNYLILLQNEMDTA